MMSLTIISCTISHTSISCVESERQVLWELLAERGLERGPGLSERSNGARTLRTYARRHHDVSYSVVWQRQNGHGANQRGVQHRGKRGSDERARTGAMQVAY